MLSKTPRLSSTHALSLTTIASKLAPTKALAHKYQSKPKTCRSELAREALESAAFIQHARVIVNDHREQARPYKGFGAQIPIKT
ncbi:hypothetical protein AWM69_08265 [Pseudomonas sp. D1HM]|nr:hypothetical protein [Pseudomonas sp. D1HM]